MILGPIQPVVVEPLVLAPNISYYYLMLTGRWLDPRSIGIYIKTPAAKRFEINEIHNINTCLIVLTLRMSAAWLAVVADILLAGSQLVGLP